MRFIHRRALFALFLSVLLAVVVGCSSLQPKSGTLITFELPGGKRLSRTRTAALSRYLVMRSAAVFDIENARVETVSGSSLVLLVPGKHISRDDAGKLLTGSGLEFYHLRNAATARHPERPWRVRVPSRAMASYVFEGPGKQRLDSRNDSERVLSEVVGSSRRPMLTGEDIRPNAIASQVGSGWAVSVEFTEAGAREFHRFTHDNRGEYLAVFYDGILISAPVVGAPIPGGKALITGFRTGVEANMAASQINAGVLPVRLRIGSVKHLGKG